MTRFLFRNLKGYRFLVVIAVLMTFAQVGADILLALPILWISNKIQFPLNAAKQPPAFLNPLISPFNRFASQQDQVAAIAHGVQTTIGVIFFSVTMLLVYWQFTLISIVIVPALAFIVLGYTTSIKAASKKAAKAAGQVANVAAEDIGAITVLKAFTLEEREAVRFNKYVGKNREAGLRAGGLQAQFTPLVGILLAIGTAIILGVGSYVAADNTFTLGFLTIAAGTITIGTLFVFLGYLKMLYQPFRD